MSSVDMRLEVVTAPVSDVDRASFDQATSIAWVVDHSAAWFTDSEGNLLVIVQLPVGAVDRPDT
jgi:hypothetical protein